MMFDDILRLDRYHPVYSNVFASSESTDFWNNAPTALGFSRKVSEVYSPAFSGT